MPNITQYQRNANQNHNEVPSHTSHNGCYPSLQTINAGESVEKREPSYIFGGNANYYSHYGERCGDSLKKLEIELPYDPGFSLLVYTLRKPELKETHLPQCSLQHCLK